MSEQDEMVGALKARCNRVSQFQPESIGLPEGFVLTAYSKLKG